MPGVLLVVAALYSEVMAGRRKWGGSGSIDPHGQRELRTIVFGYWRIIGWKMKGTWK